MPRYHFNFDDGVSYPDVEGSTFAGLEAARTEAVRRSGTMLRDNAEAFWNAAGWKLIVTDNTGLVLFTLHFAAVSAPATAAYHSSSAMLQTLRFPRGEISI